MPRKSSNPGFLTRGDDALAKMKREQQKQEERRAAAQSRGPFRFFVGKDGSGRFKTHELVILDEHAGVEAPYMYEHTIPGPNNNWAQATNVTCIDEYDDCPICRAAEAGVDDRFQVSKYSRYLTVLDLEPYTVQNGPNAGTVIPTTRKLFVIPINMMETYQQMFDLCEKQNGTTRGMVIVVTKREKNDPRCGNPQMIPETGMLFDMMDEEELEEYAEEEKVADGKVIQEEGENIEPFVYEEILAPRDPEELRTAYGLGPSAGSNADEEANTGAGRRQRRRRRNVDTPADDEPPARTRRSRRSRTADANTADSDGQGDDTPETDEDAPPPRTRRGGRSSRSRRSTQRTGDDIDDDIPFDGS